MFAGRVGDGSQRTGVYRNEACEDEMPVSGEEVIIVQDSAAVVGSRLALPASIEGYCHSQ
jgi:hypothetical protein